MLDEIIQQNASKFAIFLEYEKAGSFFFHFMLLYLFHVEKIKWHEMINFKNMWVVVFQKIWQILKHIAGSFHQA